ncbi:MAG: GxxExxY protein [Alphaproteobacteria bacterium]|nr:GxxExxY protein [Alphaproteobacteria bacterium]
MTIYEIDEETNLLSKEILDASFYIHTHLGPGLLESVYEDSLKHVLEQKGFNVEKQKILPIKFDGLAIESGFRIDLLVNSKVIVELKSCERLLPVHEAQLHTYLKLSGVTLGLLINFNVKSLKDGIKRIAMAQNKNKTLSNFV